MGHRNSHDPFGGADTFVDKMIGNAYEVVKFVARYVNEIRYVAFNMEYIYRVSQNIYENILLTQPINALGATFEINLPEGITPLMVINSSVTVQTTAGTIYGPSADTFSWIIEDGKLRVTVPLGAPAGMVGADIRWLLNWQSPVQIGG